MVVQRAHFCLVSCSTLECIHTSLHVIIPTGASRRVHLSSLGPDPTSGCERRGLFGKFSEKILLLPEYRLLRGSMHRHIYTLVPTLSLDEQRRAAREAAREDARATPFTSDLDPAWTHSLPEAVPKREKHRALCRSRVSGLCREQRTSCCPACIYNIRIER